MTHQTCPEHHGAIFIAGECQACFLSSLAEESRMAALDRYRRADTDAQRRAEMKRLASSIALEDPDTSDDLIDLAVYAEIHIHGLKPVHEPQRRMNLKSWPSCKPVRA